MGFLFINISYKIIINPIKEQLKITGVKIIPYLINLANEYSISCFFNIDSHIIPARDAIGVKYAPILDPITVAYNEEKEKSVDITEENSIDIGMLFTKLSNKADSPPYASIKLVSLLATFAISSPIL